MKSFNHKIVVAYPVGIHSTQELISHADLFRLALLINRRLSAAVCEKTADTFGIDLMKCRSGAEAVEVMKQYVVFQ